VGSGWWQDEVDLCSSSESLSVRDSVKRRNLLQSGFFRYLWPSLVIADDMNLKAEYSTTNNGSMYSTWIGGALGSGALGRGANRLVIDDPHSPADAYSEASRESAVKFISGSLFSRQDKSGEGCDRHRACSRAYG
jgi:hypothetical protein